MKKTILAVLIGNAFIVAAQAETKVVVQDNATPTALQEVVVKGERQGTKILTNVVTLTEKDESTATDLRGLLEEEPAIDFGGGNGTSSFLTVRGMGQNSVDIKVDNAYSDSQILYHQARFIIDPALVKVVSVQKGAGSASAGIGATNGAIVTKTLDAHDLLKGLNKDWGVRLSSTYSSNVGTSYGASVFGRTGNVDGLFSYTRHDEDDYKPGKDYKNNMNGGDKMPYSALDKRSYLAKIGATFGDHRFVVSHMNDQHRGVRVVREEFLVDNSKGSRLSSERQSPAYRETTLTNTNIEYTAKNLGFINKLEANAYYMKNKRYSADDSGNGYAGNVPGPTTTLVTTRGANLGFDSLFGDNVVLKYGVNYRHQEIEPHAFLNHQYVNKQSAKLQSLVRSYELVNPTKRDSGLYAEAITTLGDFTLTTGLRYDHFKVKTHDGKSVSDGKVNPSFGLIYQPLDKLSFSFTHNYASRSPRLYDAQLAHGRRGIVSISGDIKAERARNTEIGFNYNDGALAVNGSYFWQNIKDAIANPQDRHGTAFREIVNAGRIKNKGYELGVSYRHAGLVAKLGVAYSKPRFTEYESAKGVMSSNPEFAVQAGRTWTASVAYRFSNPNLEIGWQNRTVEKGTGSILVRENDAGTIVERKSYNVHDIFANWKPLGNDNLNVNFSVNNIFNKFYYPHSQRGSTMPGLGRDFRIGMYYKFLFE